jgi:signal transduction histidine kinase
MSSAALIARLAAVPSLSTVPRAELEWLATHGEVQRFDRGAVLYSTAAPPVGCYFVLSGYLTVRVTRDGLARTLLELRTGDMSGRLPYSRMPQTPEQARRIMQDVATVAEEPGEILLIMAADVREMTRECYAVTARCVHQMIDRSRLFKSDDLQREKMASLGRLAAGLAHELTNPSSAAARSASVMAACNREVVAATRALYTAGLTGDQLTAVEALEAKAGEAPAERSPLEAADREDDMLDWLETRGLDSGLAESLACPSITPRDLEALASILPADRVPAALRYVSAGAMARRLTTEIEEATRRIDVLVAAVKRHTHMDRAPAADAVDLASALADTLTLAGSKARAGAVALALDVQPGLPSVPGVAGQLNDVWLNLVDNAIDAAPEGGRITVSARREGGTVVVCVTDNGPGIPKEDEARVFEPFFTTKPIGRGAGLGLDVVQRVVRSHGGSVGLSSQPGRTEFRVTLPVAPP